MLTKDEYVADMKKRLDEWSVEIDALEQRGHEIKEDARVKYQEQLVALRAKRVEGEKRLDEMQAAAESSWEHLKAETENVWEAMKDSANTFRSHFK
jgi:hypothetical protein